MCSLSDHQFRRSVSFAVDFFNIGEWKLNDNWNINFVYTRCDRRERRNTVRLCSLFWVWMHLIIKLLWFSFLNRKRKVCAVCRGFRVEMLFVAQGLIEVIHFTVSDMRSRWELWKWSHSKPENSFFVLFQLHSISCEPGLGGEGNNADKSTLSYERAVVERSIN